MQFVNAVAQDFLFHLALDAVARSDGFELNAKLVGQFAAFGEEFKRHFLNRVFIDFAINEYVVHNVVLSNCVAV